MNYIHLSTFVATLADTCRSRGSQQAHWTLYMQPIHQALLSLKLKISPILSNSLSHGIHIDSGSFFQELRVSCK